MEYIRCPAILPNRMVTVRAYTSIQRLTLKLVFQKNKMIVAG